LKLLVTFILGVVVAVVIFWILQFVVEFVLAQASQFTTSSDLLAFSAVIISTSGLFITVIWNFIEYRRTSDIFKPVASVDVKYFPPYNEEKQETLIFITNKGRKNLIPNKVLIKCNWLNDETKIEAEIFDDFISPDETIDTGIKLPEPTWPGTHKIVITITDNNYGITWNKQRSFYMSADDILKTGNSSPL
jgi:hypothetical protein